MKTKLGLLAILLASVALAQTAPPARTPAPRPSKPREAGRSDEAKPPDPNLFDGSKFEAEKRPDMGMLGEFEMPGGESQSSKVGGNPGAAGGGNQSPPPASAGGAASAAGAAGGAAAGSEGAAGGASVDNSGAQGAVGGAMDQNAPTGSSGQSGQPGAGDPNAKAQGIAADRLEGGGAGGAAAAQNAAGQGSKSKSQVSRIGSAELRIDALPETDKDVIGREVAPGGTQGSNRAMPAGKGGQGSNNQNKGVEKGKVIPKGL